MCFWNVLFGDCEGWSHCHLIHSCHKNIQDSLCFQFSNRKDRTVTQLWKKLFLPDMHGILTWILYAVDSFISCTCLICEFLCSLFSPLVWPLSLLPTLRGKRKLSEILQKELIFNWFFKSYHFLNQIVRWPGCLWAFLLCLPDWLWILPPPVHSGLKARLGFLLGTTW